MGVLITLKHLLRPKADEGFTLVEVIVTVLIVGLLSAIALPSFLSQSAKARESEAESKVGAIVRAQQAYFTQHSTFAESLNILDLGLVAQAPNYEIRIQMEGNGEETVANVIARPTGTLRGVAGQNWIQRTPNGYVARGITCKGTPGQLPQIQVLPNGDRECANENPPVQEEGGQE